MSGRDFALVCAWCDWRPGSDLPAGLVVAHQETEHPADLAEHRETTDSGAKLNLVVVCSRCNAVMAHLATVGDKEYYTCEPCRRGKTITRGVKR